MLSKTHRNRSNKTRKQKAEIWNAFDNECNSSIKCLYQEKEEVEFCTMCNSYLNFNDENLLTCSNSKCCIIYTNILDNSA